MAFTSIIAPTTGAVSIKADFDATVYQTVIIAADVLAGAEVATIFLKIGSVYVPASNLQGTAAGLTASVASITLPGGCIYGVTKSATAGACGVYGAGLLTK